MVCCIFEEFPTVDSDPCFEVLTKICQNLKTFFDFIYDTNRIIGKSQNNSNITDLFAGFMLSLNTKRSNDQ